MTTVQELTGQWGPPRDKPDALYEFVNGQWKETPRMGALASLLAFELAAFLREFAKSRRLGLTMTETLFRLSPEGPARRPDLAFVAYERWPYPSGLTTDPPAFDVVPNLAVEVISPTNSGDEIIDKIRDYFFAGVQLVWVVYPRQRYIYVYTADDKVVILTEKGELDGGYVLPGFRLPLSNLFGVSTPPSA